MVVPAVCGFREANCVVLFLRRSLSPLFSFSVVLFLLRAMGFGYLEEFASLSGLGAA